MTTQKTMVDSFKRRDPRTKSNKLHHQRRSKLSSSKRKKFLGWKRKYKKRKWFSLSLMNYNNKQTILKSNTKRSLAWILLSCRGKLSLWYHLFKKICKLKSGNSRWTTERDQAPRKLLIHRLLEVHKAKLLSKRGETAAIMSKKLNLIPLCLRISVEGALDQTI
jgi:hypothetical protein